MNVVNAGIELSRLKMECEWFLLIFGAVTLAMVFDLIAGIIKAKQRKEARTSTGLKRTASKCGRYYLPLLCACCFDIIVSPISVYPIFTALAGLFFVVTEIISIFEKTYTKKQLRESEKTMNVILKNKEDIVKLVCEVMKQATNNQVQNEQPNEDLEGQD